MGLDMFMYREVERDKGEMKISEVGEKHSTSVIEKSEVLYLRKVNAIHNWVVDNKGGGEDNCQRIYLSIEDIQELADICNRILTETHYETGVITLGSCSFSREGDKVFPIAKQIEENGKPIFEVVGEKKVADLVVGDIIAVKDTEVEVGKKVKQVMRIDRIDLAETGLVHISADELEIGKQIANQELCEELLPTQEGFFFGSTDYDEYYIDGIKEAHEQLTEILDEHQKLIASGIDEWDINYFYVASW